MWRRREQKSKGTPIEPSAEERDSLVVVGGGMTAFHFVESLIARHADERFSITLITEEVTPPYDRIHLERVVAGEATPIFRDEGWYETQGIRLVLKERVTRIDRDGHSVVTESGAHIGYDHLVLATGSRAFVPPLEGSDAPGVLKYRDAGDAERIAHETRRAAHVTIVGGGLLGLHDLHRAAVPVASRPERREEAGVGLLGGARAQDDEGLSRLVRGDRWVGNRRDHGLAADQDEHEDKHDPHPRGGDRGPRRRRRRHENSARCLSFLSLQLA